MKTGVIVDAYSSGSLLAPEFAKKGYQMIHVRSKEIPDRAYTNAPFQKKDFIEDIYEPDPQKLLERLKQYDIRFVIPGIETSVELADFLSESLNLPTNGTVLSFARRDKYEMVKLIRKAGLHTARQIKTNSLEEMLTFGRSLSQFHVVLKALRSAGNDLVFIAKNEEEARVGFEKILATKTQFMENNTTVCVQEFLEGEEYIVDTVSANGHVVVTDIWRHTFSPANGLPVFYDYDELLSPSDPDAAELCEYTVKAVKALGIKWGPAHPEIMLTPDGPAVIEIGARLAGAGIPKLARIGLGKAQVEYTVAAFTDVKEFENMVKEKVKRANYCLWVLLLSHNEGILQNLEKFNDLEKLPSFYEKILEVKVGEKIKKTLDLTSTPGFVFLVHPDRNVVMNDYKKIRELEENGLFPVK